MKNEMKDIYLFVLIGCNILLALIALLSTSLSLTLFSVLIMVIEVVYLRKIINLIIGD